MYPAVLVMGSLHSETPILPRRYRIPMTLVALVRITMWKSEVGSSLGPRYVKAVSRVRPFGLFQRDKSNKADGPTPASAEDQSPATAPPLARETLLHSTVLIPISSEFGSSFPVTLFLLLLSRRPELSLGFVSKCQAFKTRPYS